MSARQALAVLQPRAASVTRSASPLAAVRFDHRRFGSPLPAAPFSTAASKPSHAADSTSSSRPRVDPQQPQEAKQSRRGLVLLSSALLSTGLLAGIGLTFFVPRPRIVSLVFPLPTNHPPPRESPEHRAHTKEIERDLMRLEVVKQLQAETVPAPTASGEEKTATTKEGAPAPLVKKYTVSRPYAATPPGPHSLSAYTLRGPGKFAVPPLVFTTQDKRESVLILHVGDGLCGHEGVVHGGLLATVLDEALGRTVSGKSLDPPHQKKRKSSTLIWPFGKRRCRPPQALLNLPTNIGVTATLSLKYKKPTFANQFLVIRTELTEQRGRKAWVRGKVEDLDGQTLVEAE